MTFRLLCLLCDFAGSGLCDELITRPEESYRFVCVCVCVSINRNNDTPYARYGMWFHRRNKLQAELASQNLYSITALILINWNDEPPG